MFKLFKKWCKCSDLPQTVNVKIEMTELQKQRKIINEYQLLFSLEATDMLVKLALVHFLALKELKKILRSRGDLRPLNKIVNIQREIYARKKEGKLNANTQQENQ